ncbi:acyltransferase [Massilia sp. ZL223]|uniref:acyltransferase family protein n=1 Tax=Massilia sp. ZL223 TaxID=2824904 RepID=UPI001B8376B8|nr:acyltransferase [Massilia sp. ZL223]MBQ5963369.1 acyltransferase [Massilia sp. ZL223]
MANQQSHANNFNLLRLIAAFQVMWVHALNHFGFEGPLVSALKIAPGVPTFFFISGLLISAAYERSRPAGLAAFFRNRFLRIFPALWASILVALGTVLALGYLSSQSFTIAHFAAWLAGQASLFQFYNPDFMRGFGVGVLNGALWTISVELQFYLITPVLYWMFMRRRALLATLFGLSLALNLFFRYKLDWSSVPMKLVYVSFLPWVYMFITGMLVHAYRDRVDGFLRRIPLAVVLAVFLASMVFFGPYELNSSNAISPLSFALLAALILKVAKRPLRLPTALNDFIRRNDFSYGLYLYHMPVINVVLYSGWLSGQFSLLATATLSVVAAVLSWYVVEKPALSAKVKIDRK